MIIYIYHVVFLLIDPFGKKAIILTDERECRSTEKKICQFVCGQTDYVLITTPLYIKGFECEAIIDLTSILEVDVSSRATIRLITDFKVPGRKEIIEFEDEFFLIKMIGK